MLIIKGSFVLKKDAYMNKSIASEPKSGSSPNKLGASTFTIIRFNNVKS